MQCPEIKSFKTDPTHLRIHKEDQNKKAELVQKETLNDLAEQGSNQYIVSLDILHFAEVIRSE